MGADSYRVTITDPGIGVPHGELPRLTRRFYRASNASREQFPGLGLGLTVSHEIFTRHGGLLELDSRLGEGTTAAVTLPALSAPPR